MRVEGQWFPRRCDAQGLRRAAGRPSTTSAPAQLTETEYGIVTRDSVTYFVMFCFVNFSRRDALSGDAYQVQGVVVRLEVVSNYSTSAGGIL